MFTNPYREMCVNILEKLLPRRAVQDSTLLQAYATFHMMKEVTLSGANYAEIYRAASRKSAPYLYALLADFAALKMPFPEDFVLMFDVQLDYFLRCVTPSLVADLRSFHRFFEEYGAPNLAAKVHYLVVLKLTSFKILEADEARAREKARTRSAKSEQEIPSSSGELFRGDLTDDALDRLYQVYCIGERSGSGIPLIFGAWREQGWAVPAISESIDPDRIMLSLACKKSDDKKVTIKSDDKKTTIKTARQKNEIITYLTDHISARSADIAELLGVKSTRAKKLLSELITEGIVVAEGGNRNRTYKLRA